VVNDYCRVYYAALMSSNPHPSDPSPKRPRSQPTSSGPRRDLAAGLCDSCAFQRIVSNTRGSVFSLCNRSREDPSYPRYPRLPVLDCAGHERREGARP
jgi:hypothetical protein